MINWKLFKGYYHKVFAVKDMLRSMVRKRPWQQVEEAGPGTHLAQGEPVGGRVGLIKCEMMRAKSKTMTVTNHNFRMDQKGS